jgi:thiol-disulfide isomerase/thioredoxin
VQSNSDHFGAQFRRRRLVVLAVAAIWLVAAAACGHSSNAGAKALHTPLAPLHGGSPTTLASYAGHPLVVNLWASWCVPCRTEMPRLEAASKRLGSRATVVGVSSDRNQAALRDAAARAGATYPLLVDSGAKVQDALAPANLPATYFYDAHGHLVASHQGALSNADLDRYLRQLGVAD